MRDGREVGRRAARTTEIESWRKTQQTTRRIGQRGQHTMALMSMGVQRGVARRVRGGCRNREREEVGDRDHW
eukprot:6197724-Pleurochrysis_carterae.AAC.2